MPTEPLRPVCIQASNVTPNKFYLATRSNDGGAPSWRAAYLHIRTWGTWTPITAGYAMPNWSDLDPTVTVHGSAVFIPFFKASGAINNPETELYFLGCDGRIKQSTDGGTTFVDWTPFNYGPSQENYARNTARRDMFEVQGETDEMAFFIRCTTGSNGFFLIARGADPSDAGDWTVQAFPTPKIGWVGGWPFNSNQFYLGSGEIDDLSTEPEVLFVTQTAGVSWTDITHGLRSLSNYAGSSGNRHRVIRLSPHTTET